MAGIISSPSNEIPTILSIFLALITPIRSIESSLCVGTSALGSLS
jgi:hypothetical protein